MRLTAHPPTTTTQGARALSLSLLARMAGCIRLPLSLYSYHRFLRHAEKSVFFFFFTFVETGRSNICTAILLLLLLS